MNHLNARLLCLVFILLFSILNISAAPAWNLIGLSDRSINCILADDTTMILAGTSKGMSVYSNNTWYDLPITIPVYSLMRLSAGLIAVGVGNGSKSDAVYLGKKLSNNPPFYTLAFQTYFLSPTAMTFRNDMAIPRLYVGSGEQGVSVFMLENDTLVLERAFKIPAYGFGVESPRCADLAWFDYSHLFTGGFDESPNPGVGNILELANDSLQNIRALNVTALAIGSFLAPPLKVLVIGTIDTGVILHNPILSVWVYLSRPDSGPVNDLLVVTQKGGNGDMILEATTSGVYTYGVNSSIWTALGKIPKAPQCLAGKGTITGVWNEELFAGTEEGIYYYSQTTGTCNKQNPAKVFTNKNRQIVRNGIFLIPIQWDKGQEVEITVYSASGVIVKKEKTSQKSISLNLPNGMFYYKCAINGMVKVSGVFMNF